jgi:hypothetical protein
VHLGVERPTLVLFIIYLPFSRILQAILPSHSPKNISPYNMSIKPKPPTGKIMLLVSSVIRKERPDLRRGIGVRVSTKTLRNSLGIKGLGHCLSRGRARQDSRLPVVLAPASFPFPRQLPLAFLPALATTGFRVQPSFCNPPAHAPRQAGSPLLPLNRSASAAILYTNLIA